MKTILSILFISIFAANLIAQDITYAKKDSTTVQIIIQSKDALKTLKTALKMIPAKTTIDFNYLIDFVAIYRIQYKDKQYTLSLSPDDVNPEFIILGVYTKITDVRNKIFNYIIKN